MLTNGICKNKNLFKKKKYIEFPETLRYNRITQILLEDQTWCWFTRKKNLSFNEFAVPEDQSVKTKEKGKYRKILASCQWARINVKHESLVWFWWYINNPLYTYILDIYDLVCFGFDGISLIVGYLMSNPLYRYILNNLVCFGFDGISLIVGYLMSNPLYTYILNIYEMVLFSISNNSV